MSIDLIAIDQSISRGPGATLDDRDARGLPLNDVRAELERGARLERRLGLVVSFTLHFDRAQAYGRRAQRALSISLYRDHGIRPSLVLQRADEEGGLAEGLRYLVSQRGDVESVGDLLSVEMTLRPGGK